MVDGDDAHDVLAATGQPITVPRVAEGSGPAVVAAPLGNGASSPAPAPAGEAFGRPGESVGFNTLQNAVNRNMVASLAVPCFRVGYTITTTKLDSLYKQLKPKGVTMTALLAKAVGVVLARHPQVNAATTADASAMAYPAGVNVAVETKKIQARRVSSGEWRTITLSETGISVLSDNRRSAEKLGHKCLVTVTVMI